MTPFPNGFPSMAFSITPSDTLDIKDDPNNPGGYTHCILHNPSSSSITVRVLPAAASPTSDVEDIDDLAVTIGIGAEGYSMLAVKRVYATTPARAEGDVIAHIVLQR